jgi:magnesium transporter
MAVAAASIYAEGRRVRKLALDTPDEQRIQDHQFAWIGIVDPDEAELRALQERFDLHPLAIDDALLEHPMPKVQVYEDQLFVVARTAWLDGDEIRYGETSIFLWKNHIITIRSGSTHGHTMLRRTLEAAPALLSHGVGYVLHAVLDFIVEGYMPIVEAIEDEVLAMEQRALDAFLSREEVTRIFMLRQELQRFCRVLGPMEEMAAKLEHLHLPFLDPDCGVYFADVRDHVRRVNSIAEQLREMLTGVVEVSNLLEQQRQGTITRQLAAWAAILAVPTAVAGIYGMNFVDMPELHWRFGYPAVVAGVAGACLFLFHRFRKAHWL